MRTQSLHARFRNVLLLIAATLTTLVAAVLYQAARSHYLEAGEASARAIVAAVQPSLAIGVYARDGILLDELVQGLARHPSVARVAVRDAAAGAMAVAQAGKVPAVAAAVSFEAALPSPFDAAETVGHLQVWLNTAALLLDAQRQAGLLVAALIGLQCAMLLVFNALASRLLSRPMHALAGQLARITPGQPERLHIEPRHRHDEVGVVATAANQLLDLQQQALQRERGMREEIGALEAQYRGIFDSTSAGILIMSAEGRLLQANPALARLLGREPDRPDFARSHFLNPAAWWQLVQAARASAQPEAADLQIVRGDGQAIWVHCMVSCTGAQAGGTAEGAPVEAVLYDITERKRHEAVAQHQAAHDALTGLKSRSYIEAMLDRRLRQPAHTVDAVTLMFIDLDGFKQVNDRWGHAAGDAVLVEAARRLQALFQRKSDSVGRLGGDELVVLIEGVDATDPTVSERAGALIHSLAGAFVLPNGEQASVGASVGVASYPLHATTAETLIHAADAAMYAVKQSGKGGFVIAPADAALPLQPVFVGDRAACASPALAAGRDSLTGLQDRWQLAERLAAPGTAAGDTGVAAIVCLDIDDFRSLNLTHGPQVGDEVLRETARRLLAAMRPRDAVARTGSDEFVVAVAAERPGEALDLQAANGIAHKLLASLRVPMQLAGGATIGLQATAGVALAGAAADTGVALLREAQLALRRAKASGRGRPLAFEPSMRAGFEAEVALEEDLRSAIGSSQMFLHVQPQVDRAGQRLGGEVLVRWQHPVRGLVPPDQFIPLAERCGAIVELGRWILDQGCAVLARLQQAGTGQQLSINISPAQFNHPDFVDDVKATLQRRGASAGGLVLEITEGLLITDIAKVSARLHELVDLGVRLSIDDFGTGFSSLAYLRQLPLHEIKIDRSFVAGLPQDTPNAGIVRSILSMGAHLGLHVVAEGVETLEQAQYLAALGCPAQQGWLHGRPMPVQRFLAFAAEAACPVG